MFKVNFAELERLQKALEAYEGNAESAINEVLHGEEVLQIADERIRNLIPVSGRTWKGKKGAAASSKSLRGVNGNLSLTVTTTKNYQYLYFPDDGSSTRKHAGNQQFFWRGGEQATPDIIERCVNKLITNFEKEV